MKRVYGAAYKVKKQDRNHMPVLATISNGYLYHHSWVQIQYSIPTLAYMCCLCFPQSIDNIFLEALDTVAITGK